MSGERIDVRQVKRIKSVVTTVSVRNDSALKARERIGFRRIGRIQQFRLFGFMYNYIFKKELAVLLD